MCRKIEIYSLIKSSDKVDFVDEVNVMIKDGYQPFGSPSSMIEIGGQLVYVQAMVLYMEEEELEVPLNEK